MRAVITVVGKDTVGIIAKLSAACLEHNINIVDITQKVLGDLFTMIMLVDLEKATVKFDDFVATMNAIGTEKNLSIHTMHEDIFQSMHSI